jgi:signal transduction histidine kinase
MSKDFLTMADLEQGEFQIRKEKIENFYEQIVLPAMLGIKERYPNSFDSYDNSMGGVGNIPVYGDPRLLEIVYRNLFGNALKYGNPGGRVAYGVVDLGEKLMFNVWNEGPGIEPEEREKVFEKFYRIPNEITRSKRGTGLGLYNIKRIIEAHGGSLWCESEVGRWTNFLFTLPKE